MAAFPFPSDEAERLRQLDAYAVLDTAPEPCFDAVAEAAARLFDAPIALLSIIDRDRQWLKARWGLDVACTPRDRSFCTHAIAAREPLVVPDATLDPRFAGNPLVTGEPGVRFYAGVPVVNDRGVALGALCVIDRAPRARTDAGALAALGRLAGTVAAMLDRRRDLHVRDAVNGFAESSAMALVTTDAGGRITFWNPAAEAMFGHPAARAIGRNIRIVVPERFRADHDRGLERVRAGGAPRLAGKAVEVVGLRRDGTEFPIEISLSSWRGRAGVEFGAQIQDISARRERDLALAHLAAHDPLTGLANRRTFSEALAELLAAGRTAAVLSLDLDGFKLVNDTLGHSVGDDLLRMIAVRLAARVGGDALLARMGGDEFAALLPDCADPVRARAVGEALLSAFDDDMPVGGHALRLGTSVGFALSPVHARDADGLMVRADLALLEAKRGGGSAVRSFDRGMENRLAAKRAFGDEVRAATLEKQWLLHYQPQIDLADGRVAGAEALLRWRHPGRGLIGPDLFLSTLERHSIAPEVGRWVVEEACAQLARWRRSGLDVPRVAVNLFAVQVRLGGIEAVVADALERHGLDPGDLELELTETVVLRQDARAIAELRSLRAGGVRLAFDDFGTGFASLATLKDLPVDKLKVDRSFVRDLPACRHGRAVVGGVVHLARELGLEVVAEGVETAAHRDALRSLGCGTGQGYLWGRPGPAGHGFDLPATDARAA